MGKEKISKGFKDTENTFALEGNKKDNLCCGRHTRCFSSAAGENDFPSIVRHAVECTEFPVKLAFDLGEAQSKLLFAIKYTLK